MKERIIKAVRICAQKGAIITAESDLREDLEFDSVDTIMLISELEAEFNINIDEGDFADIKTVGDIVRKFEGASV